jgi:CheY-like chemotaxis protein
MRNPRFACHIAMLCVVPVELFEADCDCSQRSNDRRAYGRPVLRPGCVSFGLLGVLVNHAAIRAVARVRVVHPLLLLPLPMPPSPPHSELLALYLAREGFNTLVAFDGTRALELASTHRLLFTVLDIMLPDMEDWEICRRLRTFSNVPILITSGLNQDHEKVKGLQLGADDDIVKRGTVRRIR